MDLPRLRFGGAEAEERRAAVQHSTVRTVVPARAARETIKMSEPEIGLKMFG